MVPSFEFTGSIMSTTFTAIITYTLITFALGYAWNMVFFREIYQLMGTTSLRAYPIMPLGAFAIILEAIVLTAMFHRFFATSPDLNTALLLALGLGAFSITYAAFVVPAKFEITQVPKYVALEIAFGLIHYGLIGLAFFALFKRTVQPG